MGEKLVTLFQTNKRLRFFGNVKVGETISVERLKALYDAVG
jgi:hypothetical protein